MVLGPMRNRYDQFGRQMVRAALESRCTIETDAEVPAETRRIDLWFMLRDARASLPEHLGLLGLEEGVKQARAESLERERKLLLRLLRQLFQDQVDGDAVSRVQAASAEQVEAWLERVLSAATLAEVLAD